MSTDDLIKAVEDKMVVKACEAYCDNICEKDASSICYYKHDAEYQVKNGFDYATCDCHALQMMRYWMKH